MMTDLPRDRLCSGQDETYCGAAYPVNEPNDSSGRSFLTARKKLGAFLPILGRFVRVAAPAPLISDSAARQLAQIGIDKRRAKYIRDHVEMAQRLGLPIPQFAVKS